MANWQYQNILMNFFGRPFLLVLPDSSSDLFPDSFSVLTTILFSLSFFYWLWILNVLRSLWIWLRAKST